MTNIQNPLHVPEEFTPLLFPMQTGAGGTGYTEHKNASSTAQIASSSRYAVKRAGLFKFKIKFLDALNFPALCEHINEYTFSSDELENSYSDSGGCLILTCLVTADSVREARTLIEDNYCGIQIDLLDDSGNPVVSNVFRTRSGTRGTILPAQSMSNTSSSQPMLMQLRFEDCAFSLWDLLPA